MSVPSMQRPLHRVAALLLAISAGVIAACGGGGDTATDANTAAGTVERATAYAAGPISGFGSIIVNGVRFDDAAATVSDDDDRARSRELLKLGMMVEVDAAGVSDAAATGRALHIRYGSQIVGPVGAVDATNGTLIVLGQNVDVTDTTVVDPALVGGIAGMVVGDLLEVHAQFDAATGRYRATRIESASGATTYLLRGVVSDLTATTFTLGGLVISYAGVAAADLPVGLSDGQRVKVRLQTVPVDGQWVATAVRNGVLKVDDRAGADLRGAITAFGSLADFEIDGRLVDASAAAFPDGTEGIVLGAIVEVHGAVADGVVVATQVELDARHARQRHVFELHGALGALDTVGQTFVLRGVRVSYAGTVDYRSGTQAALANGVKIEVKGVLSEDRTALQATLIRFGG